MNRPDYPTVRAAIAELCTEAEREAIDLVFEQGLSIRRAADELRISPSAVRDRLDSARRRLVRARILEAP